MVRVLKNSGILANSSQPQSNKPFSLPIPEIEEPEWNVVTESAGPSTAKKPKSKKSPVFTTESSSSKSDGPSKPRSRPRPVKRSGPIPEGIDVIEITEVPAVDADLEPAPQPSAKAVGKRKAVEVDGEEDCGAAVAESQKMEMRDKEADKKVKERDKGKEKPRVQPEVAAQSSRADQSDEECSKPKPKPKAKERPRPKLKHKQLHPDDDNDGAVVEGDIGTAPKKKKRKINLFSSSQPMTFDWESLPQVSAFFMLHLHWTDNYFK